MLQTDRNYNGLLEPVTCATFTKLSTPSRVYWQFYDTFTFSAGAEVTGLVLHFWRPVAPKLLTETENKLAGCRNGIDLLYYGPALSPWRVWWVSDKKHFWWRRTAEGLWFRTAEIPETRPSETNIGCHTCVIESTAAIAAEASF